MPIEYECKISVESLEPIADKLRELGAKCEGEVFETNAVLDTADKELYANGKLLRVRENIFINDEDGSDIPKREAILTLKKHAAAGEFKSREEIETRADSAETLINILENLDYAQTWYYEKYRQTWHFCGCEVVLDRLPHLGCFVEIEGAGDEEICTALDKLGLNKDKHTSKSYRDLFEEYLTTHGEPITEMRFDSKEEK